MDTADVPIRVRGHSAFARILGCSALMPNITMLIYILAIALGSMLPITRGSVDMGGLMFSMCACELANRYGNQILVTRKDPLAVTP